MWGVFYVIDCNYGRRTEVVVECDVGRPKTGKTPPPVALALSKVADHCISSFPLSIVFEHLLCLGLISYTSYYKDRDDSFLILRFLLFHLLVSYWATQGKEWPSMSSEGSLLYAGFRHPLQTSAL